MSYSISTDKQFFLVPRNKWFNCFAKGTTSTLTVKLGEPFSLELSSNNTPISGIYYLSELNDKVILTKNIAEADKDESPNNTIISLSGFFISKTDNNYYKISIKEKELENSMIIIDVALIDIVKYVMGN
jgi:hypothetical protein